MTKKRELLGTTAVPASGQLAAPNIPDLIVTEAEAATMLRLSARTLQRLRLDGNGPRWIRLTGRRLGYAIADLQEWVRSRSIASTSAATVARKAGEAA
jgi:predicted DNA-binding transcriptional regulator AlpA